MEGTILGVKSIALSQSYGADEAKSLYWQTAETRGPDVVRRILASGIPEGILMNVNFPACAPGDVTGIEVTSQCTRLESLVGVDERVDARDNPYYWLRYRRQWLNPAEKSDMWALSKGAISVTPLRLDLTDHATADTLRKAFG
jgi:5'-nucleotidase